jgi:tetratricopeptide (TPR) repeat protein
MATVDQNSLRKVVEGQIIRLEGNAFQDCMDRLGLELYPGDYQPVRAGGPRGDTKNDGYCPKARVFFAAHATRNEPLSKTKTKIRSDLEGCLKEHRDVKVWRFLTNDTLPGEVDQLIDNELRPLHPNVTIEVWGLKTLALEICKLKRKQVAGIIDVILSDEPEFEVVPLSCMKTMRDLWPILSGCLGWFDHIEPEDCTDEEQDLIDSAVQTLRDWSGISSDLEDSRVSVRDAQHSITTILEDLAEKGLALYARTKHNYPFGNEPSPLLGSAAIFKVARVAVGDEKLDRCARRTQVDVQPAQTRATVRDCERPGWQLRDVHDPFALEVQRAIEGPEGDGASSLPVLPVYVEREHDALLREAVLRAQEGHSAIVTLIGGSSTGKTRACWEAVQLLPDDWRLWHPIEPNHSDGLLTGLPKVGAHTVLWLNEVQNYLMTGDHAVGERLAAALRELLRSPERGPILAFTTAHPDDWACLNAAPAPSHDTYPQARALLTGIGISARIPDQFVCEPAAMAKAAEADPRVAEASAYADDGQFTQYLSGVPALLDRVERASPMAWYLIIAAVHLRRLGHGLALPARALETAAAALAPDHMWNEHGRSGWLENAMEYLSAPCRGVPGPLSLIRPRPGALSPDQPLYRLSDYLFEAGRYELRHDCPPTPFWDAALQHALTDEDRRALARSAHDRGRVRVSASVSAGRDLLGLYDRSSAYALGQEAEKARAESALAKIGEWRASGDPERNAFMRYVYRRKEAHCLEQLGEPKRAVAVWRELADEGYPDAFVRIGHHHLELGQRSEAEQWFRQGAAAGDDDAMQELVFLLAEDGLFDEAAEWTERIARPPESGDIYAYSRLAYRYERAGNLTQAKIYFRKAIEAGLVDCYQDLVRLHRQEGDSEGARRLYTEGIEAGETTGPMMQAEQHGEHAKADKLAFTARDHGTLQPLRLLLLHRLRQPDTLALGTALAYKAIDAGEARIVKGIANDLSDAGHHRAVDALQRTFDEADDQ